MIECTKFILECMCTIRREHSSMQVNRKKLMTAIDDEIPKHEKSIPDFMDWVSLKAFILSARLIVLEKDGKKKIVKLHFFQDDLRVHTLNSPPRAIIKNSLIYDFLEKFHKS